MDLVFPTIVVEEFRISVVRAHSLGGLSAGTMTTFDYIFGMRFDFRP